MLLVTVTKNLIHTHHHVSFCLQSWGEAHDSRLALETPSDCDSLLGPTQDCHLMCHKWMQHADVALLKWLQQFNPEETKCHRGSSNQRDVGKQRWLLAVQELGKFVNEGERFGSFPHQIPHKQDRFMCQEMCIPHTMTFIRYKYILGENWCLLLSSTCTKSTKPYEMLT